MNILLTADPELPVPPGHYGGIERIVEVLVSGLVKRGHTVTLCAHQDSTVPCSLVAWKGKKSQNSFDTLKNTILLSKVVLQQKFDIVHSFSRLAYMSPIMALRIPKIMSYQREPTLSQIKKAKMIAAKGSLVFTGCSNYITDKIKPIAEAYTIYNCAPFDNYKATSFVSDNAPLVFLGRLEEIKGVHEAIVVAQRSKRKLLIAGNVPVGKEHYFREMVQPYLGESIKYIGPVNDEQKNHLLKNAFAFLMPIQWNEPFGIVMAEAMACGTPVIGLGKGAVLEVVEQGITGYVCGHLDEMIQAVEKIGSLKREKVRDHAQKRFSEHVIVEEYIKLYQNKITNRK